MKSALKRAMQGIKEHHSTWWGLIALIPALRQLRQENSRKCEASMAWRIKLSLKTKLKWKLKVVWKVSCAEWCFAGANTQRSVFLK